MRSLLLAVVVLSSGCSLFRSGVKVEDVQPLPVERHEEKGLTLKFYPVKEPTPDDLFVCGLDVNNAGEFACIDFETYMRILNSVSTSDVVL